MEYIFSSQVNGLSSVFRDNPLEVTKPLLQMFHAKHPAFFETLDYMDDEWKSQVGHDPWYAHIIVVAGEPRELKLNSIELRRNPDFIAMMKTMPIRKFSISYIDDSIEVWLQQGDSGGEWLCEAHKTWHDSGNTYG